MYDTTSYTRLYSSLLSLLSDILILGFSAMPYFSSESCYTVDPASTDFSPLPMFAHSYCLHKVFKLSLMRTKHFWKHKSVEL